MKKYFFALTFCMAFSPAHADTVCSQITVLSKQCTCSKNNSGTEYVILGIITTDGKYKEIEAPVGQGGLTHQACEEFIKSSPLCN